MGRVQEEKLTEAVLGGRNDQSLDLAFHLAIAQATGNELFVQQLKILEDDLSGFIMANLGLTGMASMNRKSVVLQEHHQIADAIALCDGELAETCMRYHLSQARRRLTDVTRQE